MNEALLDHASNFAFEKLMDSSDGCLRDLPLPLQTVAVIYSAQGIIDNGGLEYFYESDFDVESPYSYYVDAYRRIDAQEAANCIEKTAKMFGVSDPHLRIADRRKFLEEVEQDEKHEFRRLSDLICGNQEVWEKLSDYVEANRAAFEHA